MHEIHIIKSVTLTSVSYIYIGFFFAWEGREWCGWGGSLYRYTKFIILFRSFKILGGGGGGVIGYPRALSLLYETLLSRDIPSIAPSVPGKVIVMLVLCGCIRHVLFFLLGTSPSCVLLVNICSTSWKEVPRKSWERPVSCNVLILK